MNKTHQYVFTGDVEEVFFRKLDELHDLYVNRLIMTGVADIGTDIESIKMSRLRHDLKYCQRLIGGLLNTPPNIAVKGMNIECAFTYLNDDEYLDNVYMLQNVYDWPARGKFSCQVWLIGLGTIDQINNLWNDT